MSFSDYRQKHANSIKKMAFEQYKKSNQPKKRKSILVDFADEILRMREEGYTFLQIRDALIQDAKISTHSTNISKFCKRYKATNGESNPIHKQQSRTTSKDVVLKQKEQKLDKTVKMKQMIIDGDKLEQQSTALKSGFTPTKDKSWYAQIRDFIKDLKNKIAELVRENTKLRSENIALKTKITTLEAQNSKKTSIGTTKENLSDLESLKLKKAEIEKMSDVECYADYGKFKSEILAKIEKNIQIAELVEKQKQQPKSPSLTKEDIQMIQKEYDKQNQKTQNRGLSL